MDGSSCYRLLLINTSPFSGNNSICFKITEEYIYFQIWGIRLRTVTEMAVSHNFLFGDLHYLMLLTSKSL